MNRDLHDRVLGYIAAPDTSGFDSLALEIFAAQYAAIDAYRRVCDRRGRTPASVADWRDIPAVPTLAFKHATLRTGPAERVFLTTGTTQGAGQRGRHEMPDLRLYRASALAGLRTFLFPDVAAMRLLSLIWPGTERPESSLAQMADWALAEFGSPGSGCFLSGDHADFAGFVDALRASERDGEPAAILTTSGILLHFFDHCRDNGLVFRLPHGSRLMDTGGMKGAPRTMSRNGILRAVWETFAIPGYYIVNEYGMTEMASQFYDNVVRNRVAGHFAPRCKAGPPWVRTRTLDPGTLADTPAGETGLLCHFDLANAGSAACVLTEDIGRLVDDGFEIVGRATDAEARGCSLAAAELARS
jgi:hypothetical protein